MSQNAHNQDFIMGCRDTVDTLRRQSFRPTQTESEIDLKIQFFTSQTLIAMEEWLKAHQLQDISTSEFKEVSKQKSMEQLDFILEKMPTMIDLATRHFANDKNLANAFEGTLSIANALLVSTEAELKKNQLATASTERLEEFETAKKMLAAQKCELDIQIKELSAQLSSLTTQKVQSIQELRQVEHQTTELEGKITQEISSGTSEAHVANVIAEAAEKDLNKLLDHLSSVQVQEAASAAEQVLDENPAATKKLIETKFTEMLEALQDLEKNPHIPDSIKTQTLLGVYKANCAEIFVSLPQKIQDHLSVKLATVQQDPGYPHGHDKDTYDIFQKWITLTTLYGEMKHDLDVNISFIEAIPANPENITNIPDIGLQDASAATLGAFESDTPPPYSAIDKDAKLAGEDAASSDGPF